MKNQSAAPFFNEPHAAAYDRRWARLAPMGNALHFLAKAVLTELPNDARVLCVGAGTGSELFALAADHPDWRFTAVEPATPMLAVLRRKAAAAGIEPRCEFHEGYLDTLPAGAPFDAATSILVSQFLTDVEDRREFYRDIAARLRPGGILVDAELATTAPLKDSAELLRVWSATHGSDAPSGAVPPGWGAGVAVSPPAEIESLIASAGFEKPVLFHQALFIHAWFAFKPGTAVPGTR